VIMQGEMERLRKDGAKIGQGMEGTGGSRR
jgi:hypothetical protein